MSHNNLEKEIFQDALEFPPQERSAFVQGACRGDEALRSQVESLLKAHAQTQPFPGDANVVGPSFVVEKSGDWVGRYRFLEKIGEGGFGDVWMAQQEEPIRRRVAVKLIKLGMDTREVVARFEAERQVLALMDHPNIAKVLDAGAAVTGRPYFVMELVRGIKITDYCDQNHLSTRQRLDLFVPVCQAIQHAHQKGIIHRDIKPSNILVTLHDDTPVPKVIDFGIAKATEGRLTDQTLFTSFERLVGTPAYMSPEQAERSVRDIDTRSDIYGLGVVLYELLVGTTPFDAKELMSKGIDALRKTIREQEPPRPSTKLAMLPGEDLATTAKRRSVETSKLADLIRGDLDWIIMKCLEKDRSRRYETANGLAMDLKRHLNNEPVVARPPSAAYRFQKAWRRNKLAFAASAAVAVTLLSGIGISTWLMLAAREAQRGEAIQRGEAQHKQAEAEQEKRLAERNLYIANINLAQQAWERANVLAVRHFLEEAAGYPERGFEWNYWQRQLHQDLMTFPGHAGTINALAFSPDGLRVASASDDRTAKVWDVAGSSPPMTLIGHTGTVQSVAFSPDGGRIVTGSGDRTAKIWNSGTGKVLLTLPGHANGINCVRFFPGGQRIVTVGNDGTAKTWNATDGAELRTFRGHRSSVHSVAASPDGQRFVTGSADHTAKVWDAATGNELLTLPGHSSNVNSVDFLPDGQRIVTLDWDRVVRIWDASNGTNLQTLRGHSGGLWSVAAFPDSRRVVSAGEDRTARVWDAIRGTEIRTIIGHVDGIRSVAVSADGRRIATGGWDGTIELWPAESEAEALLLKGVNSPIRCIAVSPDGRRLLTAHGDAPARTAEDHGAILWDAVTGTELRRFKWHKALVWSAVFSPDGKRIVTASWDKTAIVWDTSNGEPIATCQGHTERVWSAAFSPDGARVVTASGDGTAKVWDAPSGNLLLTLQGHTAEVRSAAYSKDGQRIVTSSQDGTARVWDAANNKLLFPLTGHRGWVIAADFSPDDRRILTASYDETACVWDATNGRRLATLEGHLGAVSVATFSPDGQRILTGSDDHTVKLWETASGKELLTLKGHSGWVRAIAFAPDGKSIYSASGVETRVWKAATTEQVAAWQSEQPPAARDPAR